MSPPSHFLFSGRRAVLRTAGPTPAQRVLMAVAGLAGLILAAWLIGQANQLAALPEADGVSRFWLVATAAGVLLAGLGGLVLLGVAGLAQRRHLVLDAGQRRMTWSLESPGGTRQGRIDLARVGNAQVECVDGDDQTRWFVVIPLQGERPLRISAYVDAASAEADAGALRALLASARA